MWKFLTAAFLLCASGASAQSFDQGTAEALSAQCVRETRAAGSYQVVYSARIPQVVAGQGATVRGARNVNDCLADKYKLQPGLRVVAPESGTVTTARDSGRVLNCREILTRSPGKAAGYSFASSVVAGAIGASVQAAVYQRNLQTCLARHGESGALRRLTSPGCGRGGVMVAGNRYCGS